LAEPLSGCQHQRVRVNQSALDGQSGGVAGVDLAADSTGLQGGAGGADGVVCAANLQGKGLAALHRVRVAQGVVFEGLAGGDALGGGVLEHVLRVDDGIRRQSQQVAAAQAHIGSGYGVVGGQRAGGKRRHGTRENGK